MDNKCIFSRKEDGICEYKNEVRTSQSEVQKQSLHMSYATPPRNQPPTSSGSSG